MEAVIDVYNIYFDKELNAVTMEWNGYATSNQFREGTELMLNTLIQNNCSGVLADIRNMTLIGTEDQKWLESNFLPRAIKFGFKKIAILKPTAYFNQVAVESISYKVDQKNLVISFFNSPEEASEWIKS